MLIFLHRLRSYSPRGPVSPRRSQGGFTLTELMVVISIMTILTSVFLLQQRQFDSSTLLRSFAYSVALSIREAQTYGVSVRSFEFGGVERFSQAHGIHFEHGDLPNFYLFADIDPLPDGNRVRNSDLSEDVETFGPTGSQFTISTFCATPIGQTEKCAPADIDSLTIMFIRPNPDACIATSDNDTACVSGDLGEKYEQARIQVQGPGGVTRSVYVTTTGQIYVGGVGI